MGIDYNNVIVSDGLVFYMDAANPRSYSGSGLTAYSLVGGIGGTLVGGLGFTTDYRGGFVFDGNVKFIDVDDFNINFSGGMTVCSYCFPAAVYSWARNIDFGMGQDNDNILLGRYSSTNNFFLEVRAPAPSNSQSLIYSNGNQFTAGSFHFIAGVLDGGTPGTATTARLYYNGNLISHTPVGSIIVPNTINRINNFIGKSNWTNDSYFNGRINSVLIYNRALSAQEILQNYNALKGRYR